MSVPPATQGPWPALKQLSGRVPLHIKLISALLTMVIIALAVISFVGLSQFKNYLQDRADAQLRDLSSQAGNFGISSLRGFSFNYSGYAVELLDSNGRSVPGCNFCTQGGPATTEPAVPPGKSWLAANVGRLVTVPAEKGPDTWRLIARQVTYYPASQFGTPVGQTLPGYLVVGADLGHLDQSVGWLAKVDLVVSAIVIAAIAIIGVAIVRASLRPLTEIEGTAAAIAAGDLSRRVPDRDPRTEMGRLGRALNAMLSQIESAFYLRAQSEAAARRSEERMRQFVADASHELRTPLTAIRGYAEYYRQRGGLDSDTQPVPEPGESAANGSEPPNGTAQPGSPAGTPSAQPGPPGLLSRPDMDRIMERVEQESSRMGGLVEDMLMLARLDEQRPVELRPVDLLSLTADAVQDARIVAPGRSIELTVGAGAAFLVLGDEPRLRQVISNLMNNALKHTPDRSPIAVRILAGRQGGNVSVPAAILEVADQGPGLSRDQAERVFERFYRADQARGRRTGGSGLGLAIVSALVTAHGGTVGVNTSPGQGATFWITFPLAPEAAAD
jgi:two-component system OmpR family sensor kinase